MEEVNVLVKDEHLPLVSTPVSKDVPSQVESPDTDKISDRDERVAISTTDTSQKHPSTLPKPSVQESTIYKTDSIKKAKLTDKDDAENKNEHLPLVPIVIAENEESPKIEVDGCRDKNIDGEDVQIDVAANIQGSIVQHCTGGLLCLPSLLGLSAFFPAGMAGQIPTPLPSPPPLPLTEMWPDVSTAM